MHGSNSLPLMRPGEPHQSLSPLQWRVAAQGETWEQDRPWLCECLLHFQGQPLEFGERKVPVRQHCVPRKIIHRTQVSASSNQVISELDVHLLGETQYRPRLLAGILGGSSLLILGESERIKKDGK